MLEDMEHVNELRDDLTDTFQACLRRLEATYSVSRLAEPLSKYRVLNSSYADSKTVIDHSRPIDFERLSGLEKVTESEDCPN